MAVQLSLNQGPQDKLLFDNTKSYFTNVGYQRTSNFQMQLRDVDSQNAANFGQTVSFIVPKAADLLGPIDLMIEMNKVEIPTDNPSAPLLPGQAQMWGWVDNVGYAMIEKITFSVGSHDVETLTGESLNIINELMRNGNNRHGFHQTLKTGQPLFKSRLDGGKKTARFPNRTVVELNPDPAYDVYDRIISYKRKHYQPLMTQLTDDDDLKFHSTWWDSLDRPMMILPHLAMSNFVQTPNADMVAKEGKHLTIPLGLFFTSHPSKYFPIAAIAGCNDIRITIKFKQVKEVLMQKGTFYQYGDSNSTNQIYDWINGPQARNPTTGAKMRGLSLYPPYVRRALASEESNNADWYFSQATFNGIEGVLPPTTGFMRPGLLVISCNNWDSSSTDAGNTTQVPNMNDAVYVLHTTVLQDPATSPIIKYRITGMTQIRAGNFSDQDRTVLRFNYYAVDDPVKIGARFNADGSFTSYGYKISNTNHAGPGTATTPAAGHPFVPHWWTKDQLGASVQENLGSGYVVDLPPVHDVIEPAPSNGQWFNKCQLRCHYVHVTGPEATALMGKEHVRLMKLMDDTNHLAKQFSIKCSTTGSSQVLAMDLNFLHPIQEIVITIRKIAEMGSSTSNSASPGWLGSNGNGATDGVLKLETGGIKNYFAYHGGGKDPNMESWTNSVDCSDPVAQVRKPTYLKTTTFQLKLNGQSRHLDGQGIDRDYLMNRMLPMIHSAARDDYSLIADHTKLPEFSQLAEMMDRKEIYVYPFALNPEGANPSGSVNFSKVSHARLEIGVDGFAPGLSSAGATVDDEYVVDVYGVYYNWLAIKDGRALTSFA